MKVVQYSSGSMQRRRSGRDDVAERRLQQSSLLAGSSFRRSEEKKTKFLSEAKRKNSQPVKKSEFTQIADTAFAAATRFARLSTRVDRPSSMIVAWWAKQPPERALNLACPLANELDRPCLRANLIEY